MFRLRKEAFGLGLLLVLSAITAHAGWYGGVSFEGQTLSIGPYPNRSWCSDMWGSAEWEHPWSCHLDGGPECNDILGNGFLFPEGYPFPWNRHPHLYIEAIDCTWQKVKGNPFNATGWGFVYYSLMNGPEFIHTTSASKCASLYRIYAGKAKLTPGDEIGHYRNSRCPGAPCWTANIDTACN